jgi:hypothetical protein
MAYIGKTPVVGNFQVCDAISVVNGQAAYTLQVGGANVIPESANHMLVSLNGILQKPGSSFTISGSTMTFASNLATGDVIDFVQILGNVLDLGTPSDGTVTNAKLAQDIISGETELAATPDDTDELLISDAGTLKRIDYSLIKPTNTPNFYAYQSGSGQQTISNTTTTVLVFDQEDYDTGSDYDTSNGRFTPGEAGKYLLHSIVRLDSGDVDMDTFILRILKNGSLAYNFTQFHSDYTSVAVTGIVQANGSSDYFQIDIYQNSGSSKTVTTNKNYTFFQGFKIIE